MACPLVRLSVCPRLWTANQMFWEALAAILSCWKQYVCLSVCLPDFLHLSCHVSHIFGKKSNPVNTHRDISGRRSASFSCNILLFMFTVCSFLSICVLAPLQESISIPSIHPSIHLLEYVGQDLKKITVLEFFFGYGEIPHGFQLLIYLISEANFIQESVFLFISFLVQKPLISAPPLYNAGGRGEQHFSTQPGCS